MAMALRLIAMFSILLLALLLPAGRLDLPFVWAYVGVLLLGVVFVGLTLDRDLLRERLQPAPGGRDRNLRIIALPFFVAHFLVAGLDAGRFHWSTPAPTPVRIAATVLMAACFGLGMWAMKTNRFFSPVVRIQKERGHTLVTGGPYRFIRHPGYASALVGYPCGAIVLGSWWSLLPLLPLLGLLLRRAILEDRFLHEHLAGYCEFAQRVRFRLIPGVW